MANQPPQTPSNQPLNSSSLVYKHPPGFRLRRVRNWVFLGLTYASYYLCRYNLGIVAPELKDEFGLSNANYGKIQSARNGAYAVGQFINGLFTDGIGGKQAMTIGAIGTIILNLLFGIVAWSNLPWLFATLIVIRFADGYVQAFGAPGMVKINTSWFRRQERGTFAGIFGAMINLGQSGVGQIGSLLATGFAVPLIFFTITVPELDWRYMFIVPPFITAIVVVLMNIMVKNHPEEAGYTILHDDEDPDEDPHAKIKLSVVFKKITSNPVVWIVAGAYFCTGFVRAAIYDWWTIYMDESWKVVKDDYLFWLMAVVLFPLLATLGSLSSGIISDKLFKGRRAPVAAVLYGLQLVFILLAMVMSQCSDYGSAVVAAVLIMGIHTGCNATHSILGTAAAMDLGGRKMAGFAAGVIDSFQYFGAFLAGWALGAILDVFAVGGIKIPVCYSIRGNIVSSGLLTDTLYGAKISGFWWFTSMGPWALLGTGLMVYLWITHRGSGKAGT